MQLIKKSLKLVLIEWGLFNRIRKFQYKTTNQLRYIFFLLGIGWIFLFPCSNIYQFQEPSLRVKIKQADSPNFNSCFSGRLAIFPGLLSSEALLFVFTQNSLNHSTTQAICNQIRRMNLRKSIILVAWTNQSSFQNDLASIQHSGKIVRSALWLNITHTQNPKHSLFRINPYFSWKLKIDTDYAYFLNKVTSQIDGFKHVSCVDSKFWKILKFLNWSKEAFCGLFDPFSIEQAPKIIAKQLGCQTPSIWIKQIAGSKRTISFLRTWVQLFSIQQDHLHSSLTFYHPLTMKQYIHPISTILGAVIFLVGIVIRTLSQAIKLVSQSHISKQTPNNTSSQIQNSQSLQPIRFNQGFNNFAFQSQSFKAIDLNILFFVGWISIWLWQFKFGVPYTILCLVFFYRFFRKNRAPNKFIRCLFQCFLALDAVYLSLFNLGYAFHAMIMCFISQFRFIRQVWAILIILLTFRSQVQVWIQTTLFLLACCE